MALQIKHFESKLSARLVSDEMERIVQVIILGGVN
jgi:hypothetical protein